MRLGTLRKSGPVIWPNVISTLRIAALTGRGEEEDESRLLKLYWNRAELKKELATLDAQVHQLRDRLKQQEGLTGRVEEEFHALEVLLGNPDYAFQAIVHYQLRALWRACHAQLEQFAGELGRQREERESQRHLQDYQLGRAQRLRAISDLEAAAEADVAAAESAVAERVARLGQLRQLWHYFRRQRLEAEVEAERERVASLARVLADTRASRKEIEQEPWPKFAGLSTEGKRGINVAVIAYAQLLVTRLGEGGLGRRAWEAQRLGVRDCHYGSRGECMAFMAEIRDAVALVREAGSIVPELKVRADRLKASASYAEPGDPVPLAESLPANEPGTERSLNEPNVLRENYWDIYRVLRG